MYTCIHTYIHTHHTLAYTSPFDIWNPFRHYTSKHTVNLMTHAWYEYMCVCMYMYIYIYTYTRTCVHIPIQIYETLSDTSKPAQSKSRDTCMV